MFFQKAIHPQQNNIVYSKLQSIPFTESLTYKFFWMNQNWENIFMIIKKR